MCLILVVTTFLAASLYRYTTSTRFLTFDASTVSARMLADSGAGLAVVLLRDRSSSWYLDDRFDETISSEALGYSEQDLGGRFELEFKRLDELYQGRGSFLSVICTGYCQGKSAKTVATVKITSPLTNFVAVSNGNYNIGAWGNPSIIGPLFVNASGDEGKLQIWHDYIHADPYREGVERHAHGNVQLGIEAKAAGDIEVTNLDYLKRTSDPLPLEGEYDKGTQQANEDLPQAVKGKVSFVEDSAAQSNVEINLKVPDAKEALFAFRNREDITTIDISDYKDGVLAEFIDGKLVLSEAKTKSVGKVYDKSVLDERIGALTGNAAAQYDLSTEEARAALKAEATIDDPLFPNEEYPAALQSDYDGDGQVETEGDYFEVGRMARGNPIATVQLGSSDFKSVRLVTSKTNYPADIAGGSKAPDLFVRGVVDGKISLAYDVTDESLDPNFNKLHTYILAEHEVPGDNVNTLASSGPGVPGGLTYADSNISHPEDIKIPGDSDDMLYLLSRGELSGTGQTTEGKKQVFRADGGVYDLEAEMKAVDEQYVSHYAGSDSKKAADYRLTSFNSPRTPLYGIFVGNHADRTVNRTTSNMGGTGRVDRFRWDTQWKSLPATIPPYAEATDHVLGVMAFRQSYADHTIFPNLRGSISSLGKKASFTYGNAAYDYRFQSMDAESLTVSLGVPTSIVLCSWQRL